METLSYILIDIKINIYWSLRWQYGNPNKLHTINPEKSLFNWNDTVSYQVCKRPKLPPCLSSQNSNSRFSLTHKEVNYPVEQNQFLLHQNPLYNIVKKKKLLTKRLLKPLLETNPININQLCCHIQAFKCPSA